MGELDEKNLNTAISLGDAICDELGICCEKRGRVIFQIYKKLREMKPSGDSAVSLATAKAHPDAKHAGGQETSETSQNASKPPTN